MMEVVFRSISNLLICLSLAAFVAGCGGGGSGSGAATKACTSNTPPNCGTNCPVGKKCKAGASCYCQNV